MRYNTAWIDEEERMIYIQTEFCSGGSLAQFVAATNNFATSSTHPTTSTPQVHLAAQRRASNPDESKTGMTEKELCMMINQISKALDYLHHREMVHFDIKPDNIFISPSTDKATSAGHDESFARPHDQPSLLRPCYKLGDLGLISDIRAKSVDFNEGKWITSAILRKFNN
jgi:serine/threonine protein kinase